MKPIEEYSTICNSPQLFFWSTYDPQVKYDCSCSAIVTNAGLIFIDPLALEKEALSSLLAEAAAPPVAILLTSGNHQRDSVALAQQLSIPIYITIDAGEEMISNFCYQPGDDFLGLHSIALPGFGPGETAFLDETRKVLILGDALINDTVEGIQLLPKKYCEDHRLAMKSLAALGKISPKILIMAHGLPIVTKASEKLRGVIK